MKSIKSICKNGIYLPVKDSRGEWLIDALNDISFTYSYGKYYFYSPTHNERSFLIEEMDVSWFTSFEKAEAYCANYTLEPKSLNPIDILKKYASVDECSPKGDPHCLFEGIDFDELDEDEYEAILNWLGVKKEFEL